MGSVNLGAARGMADELREKDEKIAEYEKLLSELARLKEDGKGYFTELTADRAEMDKSLTKVVGHVHESGELANAGNIEAAELEKGLLEAREQLKSVKEREERFSEVLETTTQELTMVVEQNKHFSTPAKDLVAGANDLRTGIHAAEEQAEAMSAFFRNMSVTALTAAIDAGRMGESASKFVQTAEDIRIESEKKEKEMHALVEALQGLTARLDALEANVEKMNLMQKDSNKASYDVLTHQEERQKEFLQAEASAGSVVSDLKSLQEKASSLKKKQTRFFEKQNAILDEMETLGQSFMEERNSSEKAEEEFMSVLGTISFSACSQTQADGAEPTIRGKE